MIDHTITDDTGYEAARSSVAVAQHGARGWLRVEGPDAVSFLHGVLTNDIAALRVGQWCYAAYLTPQGRMVSDMRVLRRDDHLARCHRRTPDPLRDSSQAKPQTKHHQDPAYRLRPDR